MRLYEFNTKPQNEVTLTELFDPESRFEIEYEHDGSTIYATAYDRQGRTLNITMGPGGIPDTVDIEFMRGGSFDITGQGDAERVLSTVIGAIEYYFARIGKPKYIAFHSKEGSRSRLYQALINRLGRKLGYVQQDPRNPPEEIADYMFSTDGLFLLKRINAVDEDISRRDFLKGAGAAAGLGTVGYGALQQKKQEWDTPASGYTGDQRDVDTEPKNSAQQSVKPASVKQEIPKYSPRQLEQYIIDYASRHLDSERELIEFMAQVKTETHDFRSLIEYGGGKDRYHGGKEFLGRGFIQVTHKHNYEKYGDMIGVDLVNNPDLLLQPNIAAKVSVAMWKDYIWPTSRRLMSKFKNQFKTLTKAVTKAVNGGTTKLAEREKNVQYYADYFRKNPPVMPNAQKSKGTK